MKKKEGFLLVGVLFIFLLLMIIVPVMVKWIQQDTKMAVKDQKTSMAFSLAEAAVDRGFWKIKSSTTTFYNATAGTVINGYNFDSTYNDISGGSYRIKISSGPLDNQFTVCGEGRDSLNKETRALKVVFTNSSVPGAIMANGNVVISDDQSNTNWGPILAKGNITLSGTATNVYYPRKLAGGVVIGRDTNGTAPPNYSIPREQSDWESNYNVPDMPDFDFTTMRSSAAMTNTLGCQDVNINTVAPSTWALRSCFGSGCTAKSGTALTGCLVAGSGSSTSALGVKCSSSTTCACSTMKCCKSTTYGGAVTCSYTNDMVANPDGCTNCVVNNLFAQTDGVNPLANMGYTWYWGNNVTWQGYTGTKGTIIARANLQISSYPTSASDDRYCRPDYDVTGSGSCPNLSPGCTVPVPPGAWKEYQNTGISSFPGEGANKQTVVSTFKLGNFSGNMDCGASGGDLGIYGFCYVGGTFARYGPADVYGALYVSSTSGTGNTMVFYNSSLKIPTLNVVLTRDSWQETTPSTTAWP